LPIARILAVFGKYESSVKQSSPEVGATITIRHEESGKVKSYGPDREEIYETLLIGQLLHLCKLVLPPGMDSAFPIALVMGDDRKLTNKVWYRFDPANCFNFRDSFRNPTVKGVVAKRQ
jgi:hypothetical protein